MVGMKTTTAPQTANETLLIAFFIGFGVGYVLVDDASLVVQALLRQADPTTPLV